jgi:peptide-methionine (S)-S-oxide reductase
MTGHNEVVLVVFDPKVVTYDDLLKVFWENHDPTQGCARATTPAPVPVGHLLLRRGSTTRRGAHPRRVPGSLKASGYGAITTEIVPAPDFYYAEDYHQQYLAKNPDGYCGLGGTGVTCPVGVGANA